MNRFFIFVFSLMAAMSMASANTGGQEGGGGDTYVREFQATAHSILGRLSAASIAGIDNEALASAIAATKVESQAQVFLNGIEKDAVNYPGANPPLIQVSRKSWDRLREEPAKQKLLVLHEYLGILKIDDSHYQLSQKLDFNLCSRSPQVLKVIEDFFKVGCGQINESDLVRMDQFFFVAGPYEEIKTNDFSFLSNIKDLKLNYASEERLIQGLPPEAFRDMRSLEAISGLKHQKIEELRNRTFIGLESLKILNVSDNFISQLNPESFEGLTSLRTLILSKNRLKEISGRALQILPKLAELDLSENELTKFPEIKFARPDWHGSSLKLSHNRIKSVPALTWELIGTNALDLDLSHNQIERIDRETFNSITLFGLNLTGNPIRDLDPNAFDGAAAVTLSGGLVKEGKWTQGMFAQRVQSKIVRSSLNACGSGGADEDFIQKLEPGALLGLQDVTVFTLCIDLNLNGPLLPEAFHGIQPRWIKLYIKGIRQIPDETYRFLASNTAERVLFAFPSSEASEFDDKKMRQLGFRYCDIIGTDPYTSFMCFPKKQVQ